MQDLPAHPGLKWAGVRAAMILERTIDLIAELARRPGEETLRCFILENVDGIKMTDAYGCRGIDEITRQQMAR
ncbi:unnamed protein product [Symbiodinium natans]|uniref:Uncharacterized protein n=1 Tax=Symbiodinium natans TaxID=878477 RepID=A0A812IXA2_9DINO|nr:unnamed protein product [Symbiodinium natans]